MVRSVIMRIIDALSTVSGSTPGYLSSVDLKTPPREEAPKLRKLAVGTVFISFFKIVSFFL